MSIVESAVKSAPIVFPGTMVIVRPTPESAEETVGWIMVQNGSYSHVLTFPEGRPTKREDCMWEGDPMIPERRHLFEHNDCGVWRLAEAEVKRRDLETRMDAIELALARLSIETPADQCDDAGPARQGRKGR